MVDSSSSRGLMDLATRIAETIDLIGVCEMSFLADSAGMPRLLELNTRPWLQIELVEKSGYPIIQETIRALAGYSLLADDRCIRERRWIHLERFLMYCLFGSAGSRLRLMKEVASTIRSRPIVAVYGSTLPNVRRKWIARTALKIPGLISRS